MNVEFSLNGVFDEAVHREAEATDRDKTALPGSVARGETRSKVTWKKFTRGFWRLAIW